MTKVVEMTELILMPISWLVSKSRETARMAMPIFVWLISHTRPTSSTSVRTGVTIVTILVVAPKIVTEFEIHGMVGYSWFRPPVMYNTRFCSV